MPSFNSFKLNERNKAFIEYNGFTEPTPVQAKVLPKALKGKDIIGISATGTGKTHAFLLPILEMIDTNSDTVQAVITAPTRELALQIYKRLVPITDIDSKVRIKLITGGMEKSKMIYSLKNQPHIVIGTPGRIKDLFLTETVLRVDTARIFVIDEADMTLEFGFLDDIDAICGRMSDDLQMMVFSATIPESLQPFLKKYLKSPEIIKVDEIHALSPKIEHVLIPCKHLSYGETLLNMIDGFLPYVCLIFANTRKEASEIAQLLKDNGKEVIELHGGLQPRQRKIAMRQLADNEHSYIVCSDIAARGIDIDAVSHVISLGLPSELEYYIHRAGRCGRAGREGTCYLLYKDSDVKNIEVLQKQGIHFVSKTYKNGEWKENKAFNEKPKKISKNDLLEKQIAHSITKKKEKVKPGYKKKRKEQVEKIKRQQRRQMIQNDIKSRQKERAKAKQRALRNGEYDA